MELTARAIRAALIPITKSEAWWHLAQDERRQILKESSHHIATGLEYLPAITRRLHHGRDLGEPCDFLTWFEFAPEHAAAFEECTNTCSSYSNQASSAAQSNRTVPLSPATGEPASSRAGAGPVDLAGPQRVCCECAASAVLAAALRDHEVTAHANAMT